MHDILVEVLHAIFPETVTDSDKTFIYLWSVALFRTTDRVLLLIRATTCMKVYSASFSNENMTQSGYNLS